MATIPATKWQTSDTISVSSLVLVVLSIIFYGLRYRAQLWHWLALLESFLLFDMLGNCFVPGSWKEFWQVEIAVFLLAVIVAIASAKLDDRAIKQRTVSSPQLIAIYIVTALVGIMVISH